MTSNHPPISLYPDPLFARKASPRTVDQALREIGAALLATAEHHRAYGLAAAHIGAVEPVVVVSVGSPDQRDYRVMYNPRIVALGAETVAGIEGSVSLPGVEVEIVRSIAVDVAYEDEAGVEHSLSLDGFAARVAQHEIDQVNGAFFLDRLSRVKREAALRRFRKLNR